MHVLLNISIGFYSFLSVVILALDVARAHFSLSWRLYLAVRNPSPKAMQSV